MGTSPLALLTRWPAVAGFSPLHIDEVLDSADAAKRGYIEPKTWASFVLREIAPQPIDRVGVAPIWTREQIGEWKRKRPGKGVGGGQPPKPK